MKFTVKSMSREEEARMQFLLSEESVGSVWERYEEGSRPLLYVLVTSVKDGRVRGLQIYPSGFVGDDLGNWEPDVFSVTYRPVMKSLGRHLEALRISGYGQVRLNY